MKGTQLRWKYANSINCCPTQKADAMHCIRSVDEDGEDYVYPENLFMPMEVSESVSRALHKQAA
jgi:hypothetical protein